MGWQTAFGNNLAKTDNIKSLNLGFLDFNPAQNLSQEYSTFSDNDNYFFRSSIHYSLNENIKIGLKYGLNTGDNNQPSTGYVWNETNELSNSKGSPASKNTLNDITFSYSHNLNYFISKGTYQIYYLNLPIQALNFVLTKPFLKNQLKVSLYANDIFNTNRISALAQSENLNINYSRKDNTQYFGVKLSYNFGKFSAMHKQQEIEDIDEKERLEEKKEIKM